MIDVERTQIPGAQAVGGDRERFHQAIRAATAAAQRHDLSDLAARLAASGLATDDLRAVADLLEDRDRGSGPMADVSARRPSGRRPRSTSHKERAKAAIEEQTGGPLRRVRGDTYQTAAGRVIHVRSMKAHPRGRSEASYWFGLRPETWVSGEFFVFVCGDDALFVVPVDEMTRYRRLIPTSDGTAQPTIWRTEQGVFELRVGGEHIDFTTWRDRFDLLS